MRFFKYQSLFWSLFILIVAFTGCSKDENDPVVPVDPDNPENNQVPLTQLEVMIDNQTSASSHVIRSVGENTAKTTFVAGDYFILHYNNLIEGEQKAYAHTADGKTWTIREGTDVNSQIKTVLLDKISPTLRAEYVSTEAMSEKADQDGISVSTDDDRDIEVMCYDVLRADAVVTVGNNKSSARIGFLHINHLLSFNIEGRANEMDIDHLQLQLTYTNTAGTQQKGVLRTSTRDGYTDAVGKVHNVLQAIVPRGAVVDGIKAMMKVGGKVYDIPESINMDCPGGKSRLVTLNVGSSQMTTEIGTLTEGWIGGGEMNPDGSPVGDIYIRTADELRAFAQAVNSNPSSPTAKINGVLAYTAHVVQMSDIDLSSFPWRPIGGAAYSVNDDIEMSYFAGTYNGNGYKISGMKVSATTAVGNSVASYGGLFGSVQSPVGGHAVLTNIQLVDVDIDLTDAIYQTSVGALVGSAYAPIGSEPVVISLCSVQGKVKVINNEGRVSIGGLVGDPIRVHITGSHTNVAISVISGGDNYTGGFAGRPVDTIIASSYAQNSVSGQSTDGSSSVGGIAGMLISNNYNSYVIASRSDGVVSANGKAAYAGGLVGQSGGTIAGSFAIGKVTATGGSTKAGALAGSSLFMALCYGTSEGGAGSSNVPAVNNNVVYNNNSAAGDVLSIVTGKAWADTHNGNHRSEAITGGVLTTIPVRSGGVLSFEVEPRLWVLFDDNVWSTSNPGNTVYPVPVLGYKGQ